MTLAWFVFIMTPECEELIKRLKTRPCSTCTHELIPSELENGKPLGCLAAHVMLCLLEAKSAKVEQILKPVWTEPWTTLSMTLVFHDVGKLTEEYHKGKRFHHGAYSAGFVLELWESVERLLKQAAAFAILLHHEYRQWKRIYTKPDEDLVGIDLLSEVPRLQPKLDEARVLTFVERLWEISETSGIFIEEPLRILEQKPAHRLQEELKIHLGSLRLGRHARKFGSLAYLLQLIDNRAAIFREKGVGRHLQRTFQEVLSKSAPESYANLITKSLKHRAYRFLTLLPEYLTGGTGGRRPSSESSSKSLLALGSRPQLGSRGRGRRRWATE